MISISGQSGGEDSKKYTYLQTALRYSKTQRGRIMLLHEGYKYVENRQSNKNTFWRCSRYVKFGCRASVVTSKDPDDYPPIRITGNPHSHAPEPCRDTSPEINFLALGQDTKIVKIENYPLKFLSSP